MLTKQDHYPVARQLAVQSLLRTHWKDRAAQGGGWYEEIAGREVRIGLRYLSRELCLSFPQGKIEIGNEGEPLSLREEILILHYLEKATGAPLTGRWVSFAEIPGGAFYDPVFRSRCRNPLVKFFGEHPEEMRTLAEREFRGEPSDLGDVGIKIRAFPYVLLGLALWRGDTEFPPEGGIVFDASVAQYLPVEDIVILTETVVWKLVKAKRREPSA